MRSFWAVAAAVVALAGCANPNIRTGEDFEQQGQLEEAARMYRRALAEDPGQGSALVDRIEDVERRAAEQRYRSGLDQVAEGNLPAAIDALSRAVKLDPGHEKARAELPKVKERLKFVESEIARAKALKAEGKALEAVEALAPLQALRIGTPEVEKEYREARRAAAGGLRETAARKIATGDIAGANADLERAAELESDGVPGKREAAAGGGEALDRYARAAADVKRLTGGLPKRRPGGGIARAEDYAMPEGDLGALETAIADAVAAKPPGEKVPTWLSHGRVCLRMARETAVLRRLDGARARADADDLAAAWAELQAARAIDPESFHAPEAREVVDHVRRAVGKRLLEIARRELGAGYANLARVRARQAVEIAPMLDGDAREVLTRADSGARARAVVVMPFQNYTTNDALGERLNAALLRRLSKSGAGPAVPFDVYRKGRDAGAAGGGVGAPVAGLVRGDVLSFVAQDARDAAAVAEAHVAAHRRVLDGARRRLAAASGGESEARARSIVEEAERALARAERDRASSVVAAERAGSAGGGGAGRGDFLVALLEIQFQIHDPESGRDVAAEPSIATTIGLAKDRVALEDKLIETVVEPVATAVEARFYDLGKAEQRAIAADARKALDARAAVLERQTGAGKSAPDAGAAAAVLEATGYSYAERRTIPERLRLE